jgi:hypothetical protein
MPVVAAAAADGHWSAAYRRFNPDAEQIRLNEYGSNWIALSPSAETMAVITRDGGGGQWERLSGRPGFHAWTDDHASVLPLIKL